MDLLSSIATCSLHGDSALVIAMAMAFSHGNPYTVLNVAESALDSAAEEQDVSSKPEAAGAAHARAAADAQLRDMLADDGLPVVGVLPVPASWAAQFGRKPTDLLNQCINISIATAKLSEFEYACGGRSDRSCVLREYALATGMDWLEQDVLDELALQGLSKDPSAAPDPERTATSPLTASTAEERDREWGADRLFFVLPSDPPASLSPARAKRTSVAPKAKR